MTPDSLARTVQEFLSVSRDAVVLEDGGVTFDLASAKYSISGEHGKCLLHLWSAERNVVRRVVDAELKNNVLRLSVQKLGQSRPSALEICRDRDRGPFLPRKLRGPSTGVAYSVCLSVLFLASCLTASLLPWIWNARSVPSTHVEC